MKRKKQRTLPAISTASLPDIIFMLLFFFMVVTVMRKNSPLVHTTLPATTYRLQLSENEQTIIIRVGTSTDSLIQVNGHLVFENDLPRLIRQSVEDLPSHILEKIDIVLYTDQATEMGTISKIKAVLQREGLRQLKYITRSPSR